MKKFEIVSVSMFLLVCVFAIAVVSLSGCRVVIDDPINSSGVEYAPCDSDANCQSGLICEVNSDLNEFVCQAGCRGDVACKSEELCSYDNDLNRNICVSGCYVTEATADETTTSTTTDAYGNETTTTTTITRTFVTYDSCKRKGENLRCDVSVDPYECISTATDGGVVAQDGGVAPVDGGLTTDGGSLPADGGAVTSDGGYNPPTEDGGAVTNDGGNEPPAEDGGAVTNDGGNEPPAEDGGAVTNDGGNEPPAEDGGVLPADGGAIPADGGVVEAGLQVHICCPIGTGEVALWYGSDAYVTSNGTSCGDFWMSLAAFCQRGAHPNSNGGWFTYNCHQGAAWGGWTQTDVTSITNQNGSPYGFSVIRGTVNASGVAEVIVHGTCQ